MFNDKGEARVTSNWKTQNGWQDETLVEETDWLDEQTGREFLSKCFFHSFVCSIIVGISNEYNFYRIMIR